MYCVSYKPGPISTNPNPETNPSTHHDDRWGLHEVPMQLGGPMRQNGACWTTIINSSVGVNAKKSFASGHENWRTWRIRKGVQGNTFFRPLRHKTLTGHTPRKNICYQSWALFVGISTHHCDTHTYIQIYLFIYVCGILPSWPPLPWPTLLWVL